MIDSGRDRTTRWATRVIYTLSRDPTDRPCPLGELGAHLAWGLAG